MSFKNKLSGVFAPLTTPFTKNEAVDFESLRINMECYSQSGLHGFLVLGSNGENKSLDFNEKLEILRLVMETKAQDQVVMAGCMAESTRETIRMAQRFEEVKCDFITLIPPSYFKRQMTDEILESYFANIADALQTPCLLYNAPAFSGGTHLSAALVKELSLHGNIVGIKDSSAGNILSYLLDVPDDFSVMSGTINNFMTGLFGGATGGIVSLANVFPKTVLELYRLYSDQQYVACLDLNMQLLRLNRMISGSGGVSAVKAAMDMVGLRGGIPRHPLQSLTDKEKLNLARALNIE